MFLNRRVESGNRFLLGDHAAARELLNLMSKIRNGHCKSMRTYGDVETMYFPSLLISITGAYVPGPGVSPFFMMCSGSTAAEDKQEW